MYTIHLNYWCKWEYEPNNEVSQYNIPFAKPTEGTSVTMGPKQNQQHDQYRGFLKIGVPPKSSILKGFSNIITTIIRCGMAIWKFQ